MFSNRTVAAAALVLLSACADRQPLAVQPDPVSPGALAQLICRADLRAGSFACAEETPRGPSRALITLGGQNHYVRLSNDTPVYDPDSDLLTVNVAVQNLLQMPLGSATAGIPDSKGVRVFFSEPPLLPTTVQNAAGQMSWLNVDQDYFEYTGNDLSVYGYLNPGEKSQAKPWQFKMNGATSFVFKVYVTGEVPAVAQSFLSFGLVSAGENHTCALTRDGVPYCWGWNAFGQVGDNTNVNRTIPVPVQMPAGVQFDTLALGGAHGCGLTADGLAYCWGTNLFGGLGNGTQDQAFTPTPVAQGAVRFASLSLGNYHSCGLTSEGKAYCWGYNTDGEVGNNSTSHVLSPAAVQQGSEIFTSIRAGYFHTCALTTEGYALCWGTNTDGRVGNGNPAKALVPVPVQANGRRFSALTAGGSHSCGLSDEGQVWCWGSNSDGQLGTGASGTNQTAPAAVSQGALAFTTVEAGHSHTCALTAEGAAYCWGRNLRMQMGNGGTAQVNAPGPVQQGSAVFASLSVGGYHACATTASGPAYCWGAADQGRRGDGLVVSRSTPGPVAASR
ncbi:MAG TPA: hypothetical protein VF665_04960 [Longimicrobium sp.]|jgi:alpha-tubulin suppressor-like RCC1 family protein|uniref:RCC1 domain-containing protein n=1 Tax=Longimicrobium sp. TaxID=2029185 RepID=UPI002EDA81FA